jgi:uncharacterized protein YdaT
MSYFLARYLYRKYKNRNRAPESVQLGEHEQQEQVALQDDQLTTSNEGAGTNSDAVREKTPSSDHRQIPDGNGGKKHKQVPLCEHQLALANGAGGVNGEDVLHEKGPGSEHQQIPDEKRGSKHCSECIAEKKQARIYRWKLILSLLVPNVMASMDLTITASALPIIASHFSMLPQ